jgi:ATP-dependent DNA helicase PIF1
VLSLAEKDFVPGLLYVGVSRVKSLNGLMLEEGFDLSRFRAKARQDKRGMRLCGC